MSYPQWQCQLQDGLAGMTLSLSEGQQQQLLAFLALLNKWNKAYNLTAVRDEQVMVSRQLLDSLSILPWLTTDHLLDVGAGGGLPGIPLAIACPDKHFTLLDSNGKKTRFLNQCVLELGLKNVAVIHGRAEDCRPEQPFSQISSRAFTALENLVSWCSQLLANDGQFLAMKGQYPDDEVSALPEDWRVTSSHSLKFPGADGERHLLIVARAEPSRQPATGGKPWRA